MIKYLLDTNILRHYTDGHQTLLNNLARVPLEQVVVPFILFARQMRGNYDALWQLGRPVVLATCQ